MAGQLLGADNTGDSGTPFKVVVRLCGLAAIAGIFLPFIGGASILDLINSLRDTGSLGTMGSSTMGTITHILLLSGFILLPLFGIGMVIRGKYAGGPFTFLILYNLAAFFLVMFYGPEAGGSITGNFFVNTGLGYWISAGGLFAPFMAMFFLDKSI